MFNRCLFTLLAFVLFYSASATHNRAGEITYKRIAPFTKTVGGVAVENYHYLITIVKYTDDGPGVQDRCDAVILFGDGDSAVAPRVNGPTGCGCGSANGVDIGCGELIIQESSQGSPDKYWVKKNVYVIEHTYPGAGSYYIRHLDPNRNAGVHNIPNSVNLPFYIESFLVINIYTGPNSSPVFSFPPIDKACVGECFYHDPGAYDPDKDDSLSFEITTSRGANGQTVTNYSFPEYSQTYNINSRTGRLTWCAPIFQDEYNIAFIVKEWRKNTSGSYQMIGYVLRDMQVIVGDCRLNHVPHINVPADTCVEAGALVEKNIFISDPNGDLVVVEGGGGAFAGTAPFATLNAPPGVYNPLFRWQTTCDHIRKQPYLTTFKATDNGSPIKLVSFETYAIRVIPPSVKNVTAVPVGSAIKVSWLPSTCSPASNPLKGYKIYRKNECAAVAPSPCETGVPAASGFILVGEVGVSSALYLDDNNGDGLVVGQNYSYLVVAVYNDGTESYGSSAVCAELKRDVPVLLNVDVLSTSASTGSVYIHWALPLTTPGNLDLNAFPGPYAFNLKYRGASGSVTTVFTSTHTNLDALETLFYHTGINTINTLHAYQVEFISGNDTVGYSPLATSVFLSVKPADRKITLEWSAKTPWTNKKYTIFRKVPQATSFEELATTSLTTHIDSAGVANRNAYCYYVASEGEYSRPDIYKPLINRSQEVCATAIDLTPPCMPTLQVEADCPTGFVRVSWTDVRTTCSDDVVKYYLSYKPTVNDEYTVIETDTTSYTYDGLAYISGCYAIQAVDSTGNKSIKGPDYCIDNCPEFELPNIFSPDGDGVNDYFMAIKVRQVKEINLNIFDRWGNLVYHTNDPYFKWNSTSIISDKEVSEGVFFYACDVLESRLKGVLKRTLKGTVHLVR